MSRRLRRMPALDGRLRTRARKARVQGLLAAIGVRVPIETHSPRPRLRRFLRSWAGRGLWCFGARGADRKSRPSCTPLGPPLLAHQDHRAGRVSPRRRAHCGRCRESGGHTPKGFDGWKPRGYYYFFIKGRHNDLSIDTHTPSSAAVLLPPDCRELRTC